MDSQRLLDTFLDLTRLYCLSGHEKQAAEYCAEALRACGCTVQIDDAGEKVGSDTGNLYAELPGTAAGSLVLTAHLDTVGPCEGVAPQIRDGVVYSDGTTILGADDKVGVAAILEAVRTLAEGADPYPTVKVVFSIQEETGCLGAGALGVGQFEGGEPCYVFDGDGEPGLATLAAPYHYTFEARFKGKASHAGVAPDQGISAIEMAARAVMLMRERGVLGAVGEYCASNIGTIEGGQADNVVAPECRVTGECRAVEQADVARVHEAMDQALREAAEERGGTVEVEWNLEYRGYSLADDAPAVRLFNEAVRSIGLEPATMKSAGGTDANRYVDYGLEPLVVSTGMTNFHALDECLKIEDLENTARIAIALACTAAR